MQTADTFGATNYAVLSAYLLCMLAIGWLASRRIKDTRGFFLAEGRMNYILVGLSILGTYLSGLTMMALPAMAFKGYNLKWSVQLPFLVLTAFIITRFVLPRYRDAGVVSVYEFLEQRIHVSARLLASVCYILMSIGRMGLVLYLPALALHIVTGFNLAWTIVTVGIVVTLYTVTGGIEAVIWTDAIQVVIFIVGAVATVVMILAKVGWGNFVDVAARYNKFEMLDLRLDFTQVVTLWLILETIFQTIRIYGTQQDIAQRYMTTRSTKEANRSVWGAILCYIPLGYLFYFIGTALFVFYKMHPDNRVAELIAERHADAIYPYFVVTNLPVGLSGLIIAAFFAAAMSSLDSSMNSCSTVCIEDFYKRLWKRTSSERHYLLIARLLTIVWGACATGMALSFMKIRLAQVVWSKIMGISTNGVLALLVLALLPMRLNPWAVAAAFAASYALLFYIMWGTRICFLLWAVIGNTTCFLLALIFDAAWKYLRPQTAEPTS